MTKPSTRPPRPIRIPVHLAETGGSAADAVMAVTLKAVPSPKPPPPPIIDWLIEHLPRHLQQLPASAEVQLTSTQVKAVKRALKAAGEDYNAQFPSYELATFEFERS